MFKLLYSRRVAVYLLCLLLALLFGSALLPSPHTVSPQQWRQLQQQGGGRFWIYSHLSIPFIVGNPFFIAASLLLFLSTLACTMERARQRWSSRSFDFPKDRGCSFATTGSLWLGTCALQSEVESLLSAALWRIKMERSSSSLLFTAEKGRMAFWGSMAFHAGLLVCFLATAVSYFTNGSVAEIEGDEVTAVLVVIAFALVATGLFARCMSHERRIEVELADLQVGTAYTVRGYSKCFPATLEREVLEIAARLDRLG